MPVVEKLRDHKLLLDTHVWLAIAAGNAVISKAFVKAVDHAVEHDRVLIAAISVWEVGMLAEKRRIILDKDPLDWVTIAFSQFGFKLVPLNPKIAIGSCRLPDYFHGDPADRMLVVTAQEENAVLVTYDSRLLTFGKDPFFSVHDPRA